MAAPMVSMAAITATTRDECIGFKTVSIQSILLEGDDVECSCRRRSQRTGLSMHNVRPYKSISYMLDAADRIVLPGEDVSVGRKRVVRLGGEQDLHSRGNVLAQLARVVHLRAEDIIVADHEQ